MFGLIVFFLIVFIQITNVVSNPVLIWGTSCPTKPTMQTVKKSEFANVVRTFLEEHMVLVIKEKELSAKDFMCRNPRNSSQSCFEFLANVQPKTYFANVEYPSEAIELLNATIVRNSVNDFGRLKVDALCRIGTIHEIEFKTIFTVAREIQLQIHDHLIRHLQEVHFKKCPVTFLYTSEASKINRRLRRQDRPDPDPLLANSKSGHGVMYISENLAFYAEKGTFKTKDKTEKFKVTTVTGNVRKDDGNINTDPSIKPSNEKNYVISITTSPPHDIKLFVIQSKNYYTVKSFEFDFAQFSVQFFQAPYGFSYSCGSFQGYNLETKSVVTVHNIQFEVFRKKPKKSGKFSPNWDCGGVFTPGIIMGLFVTALLLSILFWGICMIMDIKANDKMEDRNGPKLVIKVQDRE